MSHVLRQLVVSRVVGKTRAERGPKCSAMVRKAVLISYADRANDDGTGIFVSKERIAAENEMDRDSVTKATQALEADALLMLDASVYPEGKRPARNGFTYCYRINVAAVMGLPEAWAAKCRNSGTLDDALADGDEPLGKALGPVDKWARKRRNTGTKVPENPRQSADQAGMNSPSRTRNTRAGAQPVDSLHRRADPEYAREGRAPAPEDPQRVRIERELSRLRVHLATARRGEEIARGEFAGLLPRIAARMIEQRIGQIEQRLKAEEAGA